MKVNCENPRRMPSLGHNEVRGEVMRQYFSNFTRFAFLLHRFFTDGVGVETRTDEVCGKNVQEIAIVMLSGTDMRERMACEVEASRPKHFRLKRYQSKNRARISPAVGS